MKTSKNLLTFFLFILFVMPAFTQESGDLSKEDKIVTYYFHNERRCATCLSVEKVSKSIVKELYDGQVEYKVFNIDGDRGKAAAKKLGIEVQSLLIVKGDKIINLTVDGFRFAKNDPEKLKAIFKENIDPLL